MSTTAGKIDSDFYVYVGIYVMNGKDNCSCFGKEFELDEKCAGCTLLTYCRTYLNVRVESNGECCHINSMYNTCDEEDHCLIRLSVYEKQRTITCRYIDTPRLILSVIALNKRVFIISFVNKEFVTGEEINGELVS